jgi:hypothetical protein
MSLSLRVHSGAVALVFALTSSAVAASPCVHVGEAAKSNPENAARWAQAARELPAPLFTARWSRRAEQAFGQRFARWRAVRLALVAGAVSEWLDTEEVDESSRAAARCFATRVERGRSLRAGSFDWSNVAWEVLAPIGRMQGPEREVATWAQVARALTELVVEERRAEASYALALPPTETNFYYGYLSQLGPYNEVEETLARRALNVCIAQSTLRETWTRDSEECEQLRGRVFRSEPAALDELRPAPDYVAVRFPGAPVALRAVR